MYIYYVIFKNEKYTFHNTFEKYEDAIDLLQLIIENNDHLIKFGRIVKYD